MYYSQHVVKGNVLGLLNCKFYEAYFGERLLGEKYCPKALRFFFAM